MTRSISDYRDSTNHQIEMIRDVFLDRTSELGIDVELETQLEHISGLEGYIRVHQSGKTIDISKVGDYKYMLRYEGEYNINSIPDEELDVSRQ